METSITISGDLVARIAKAVPPGSGVTIACQDGLIQYHAADGAAPPASAQPIDSYGVKLRLDIANVLGMEYKNDAHFLDALTNAILPPNSQDVLRVSRMFDELGVPLGQFNNAIAKIQALLGNTIQRQIDLNDTHKIFAALGIDPQQEKNCYLLAFAEIKELQKVKSDRDLKLKQLSEIGSALGLGEGIFFSEIANHIKSAINEASMNSTFKTKVFDLVGINQGGEFSFYEAALDAIRALKENGENLRNRLVEVESIFQIDYLCTWAQTSDTLKNIQSDRLRAKAYQQELNAETDAFSRTLVMLRHDIKDAVGGDFASKYQPDVDIVDAVKRLSKGNAAMSQQIVDLQRTLQDLRCGVASKFRVEFSTDSWLLLHIAFMQDELKMAYEQCDTYANKNKQLQRDYGQLRLGIIEKLGLERNASLIDAVTALRDEHKSCMAQLELACGKLDQERTDHQLAQSKIAGLERTLHSLRDYKNTLNDTLHDLRRLAADAIGISFKGDNELIGACATAKQSIAEYELDMEKICAALGVNSASNVDYITSTIASLKSAIEPVKAQLTYKVHDDGAYWHVSADGVDDMRFRKGAKYYGVFVAYITKLETVFDYKERK